MVERRVGAAESYQIKQALIRLPSRNGNEKPMVFLRCMATSREGLLQADFFCGGTQSYCKAGRTAAHQAMGDII